ncbi:MAG: winged helix-turn-helix domain-containing protein [Promethearchaeota archaeon]
MSTREILPNSNLDENTPNSKNIQDAPDNPPSEYNIGEIFQNSIRSKMWGLFSMYPELTLADLSKYLKKSKSTIHPHLKLLEKMGLIEEIREKKVRGAIKSKIYSLKKDYDEKFKFWGVQPNCKKVSIDQDIGIRLTEDMSSWIKIQVDNLNLQKNFFQELRKMLDSPEKDEALEILNRIYGIHHKNETSYINSKKTLKAVGYFDEGTYQQLQKLFKEFYGSLAKISQEAEKDNPTIEKPYYFVMNVISMKDVYDLLFRNNCKDQEKK